MIYGKVRIDKEDCNFFVTNKFLTIFCIVKRRRYNYGYGRIYHAWRGRL